MLHIFPTNRVKLGAWKPKATKGQREYASNGHKHALLVILIVSDYLGGKE